MSKPTTKQIRAAAHRLYDGVLHDPQMIVINDAAQELRHEDDDPGTWITVSVWVPDRIALEQEP